MDWRPILEQIFVWRVLAELIRLLQDRDQSRNLVNTVMNICEP
jgi:hypothetical protein